MASNMIVKLSFLVVTCQELMSDIMMHTMVTMNCGEPSCYGCKGRIVTEFISAVVLVQ